MIRALFDANIIVAFYTARGGTLLDLYRRRRDGEFRIVLSHPILDEVSPTWATTPYWQNRLTVLEQN